jgi:hypothetical protein
VVDGGATVKSLALDVMPYHTQPHALSIEADHVLGIEKRGVIVDIYFSPSSSCGKEDLVNYERQVVFV